MAFPNENTKRSARSHWVSPEIQEIIYEGGRRYEGYQQRRSPITDDQLDYQTKRFHEKVTESYQTKHPSRKSARFAPSASAGQVHGDREVFYSSTERVNHKVGLGISGLNPAYNRAVESSVYARHNYDNRCAESGTTGMIQRKYGNNVDMRGDRISTYGMIPDEDDEEAFMGFHPGCASRKSREPPSMGCEDVLDAYGITDIHHRRRSQGKKY